MNHSNNYDYYENHFYYQYPNLGGISLITEQLKEAAEYLGLTHKVRVKK